MLKDSIQEIIKDIKEGKMVIILDDESRENEKAENKIDSELKVEKLHTAMISAAEEKLV